MYFLLEKEQRCGGAGPGRRQGVLQAAENQRRVRRCRCNRCNRCILSRSETRRLQAAGNGMQALWNERNRPSSWCARRARGRCEQLLMKEAA